MLTKIGRAIALIIFVLAMPLLLFSSSVRFVVNDLGLYHGRLLKYDIPRTTGNTLAELDHADKKLVRYFNSNEEYVRIVLSTGNSLFNQKEIIHLKDVKELIQFDYRLQWLTLAYVLGYIVAISVWKRLDWWQRLRVIGRGLQFSGRLTVVLMALVGLGLLVAFDRVFLAFHLLGFSNLLWVLDPATDKLIQMFPQGFFFDAALFLAGVTLGLALSVGVIGWGMGFYSKRRLVIH